MKVKHRLVGIFVMLVTTLSIPCLAQTTSNSDGKKSAITNPVAAQVGMASNRNQANPLMEKNGIKGSGNSVSMALDQLDSRFESLNDRVARIEAKQSEKSGAWKLLVEFAEKAVAEVLGFVFFALVLALLLKHDVVKAVREGLEKMGSVFAASFVAHVVPEIINFRQEAIQVLKAKSFNYSDIAEPGSSPTPDNVLELLKPARELIQARQFIEAELALLKLSSEHPGELAIALELLELFESPGYESLSGVVPAAQKALKFMTSRETSLGHIPEYWLGVARCYWKFAGTGLSRPYYTKALEAANRALELDKGNPRWLSLRGLVHDNFSVVVEAVKDTEAALEMSSRMPDGPKRENNIARAKNNLAYYYAELGQAEKKAIAIKYANEAYEFDLKSAQPAHISLDTVGYVLMSFAETREELEKAVQCLSQAVEGDPQDAELADHLAEAKQRLDTFPQKDC